MPGLTDILLYIAIGVGALCLLLLLCLLYGGALPLLSGFHARVRHQAFALFGRTARKLFHLFRPA